jgi:hypothetical protein
MAAVRAHRDRTGKHVMVEKPLAESRAVGERMVEVAEDRGLVLMTDHTFCYTPVVQRIAELIGDGTLGEILFIDSVRINLGLIQPDVNVFWDLAPHDLSILDYVLPGGLRPLSAGAYGADPLQTGGVSITRGGGNTNTASGVNSFAGQSATTIGGMARGHGYAATYGGGNSNRATARNSTALQDTTTVGGSAFGRGAYSTVYGGHNTNLASGVGSMAGQSVTTLGGTAFGRGASSSVSGGYNSNLASGRNSEAQQQVLTMGGSAVGRGAVDRVYGGGNRNAATARGAFAGQQVVTVGGQ